MYQTILIPTDGSDPAKVASEFACDIARRFDAQVHVIHVEEPRLTADHDGDDETYGERIVNEVDERATAGDVAVTTATIDADRPVHRTIIDYATDNEIDAIVMGTHGRTGIDRFVLGSVAEQTLREAPVPVVTVHEDLDTGPRFGRILVATDGSDSAVAAAEHAIELADATGAALSVVSVTGGGLVRNRHEDGRAAVDTVAERAEAAGIETVETDVIQGTPYQTILAYAAEHDVGWIVMGSHGRTAIRRYLLGGVTERVVRFAQAPVISVKAPRVTSTVEYLDYEVLDDRGWSIDDELFETAAEADLDESAHGTIEVAQDEYLLDAAEAAGHDWPFYCRAGGCVNCAAVVVDGEVEMDVQRTLSEEEMEEQNLRLTCVATPATEEITLVYNAKQLDVLQDRVI